MSNWRVGMEVGRMAFYVSFPVALFYIFNQPQIYNKFKVLGETGFEHLDTSDNEEDKLKLKKQLEALAEKREKKWREEYEAKRQNR